MHRLPLTGVLSSRLRQRSAVVGMLAAAIFAGAASSQAGTATYDFETDPLSQGLTITTSHDAAWVTEGGNPGGFLAITYAENDQNGRVVFPDIDAGKLVAGFRFEADVRAGNSSGDRPADGFSISFARTNDRFFTDGSFAVGGPPEFGTETGLAILFDTWAGNVELPGGDIEGLIIRVDNVSVSKTALPTRNGACEDTTSLQTGLRDAAFWADPERDPRSPASWDTLCWQKVIADLDVSGKLTVSWKGLNVLSNYQTTYFPSASRLVLAGRTGNANQHTHFDNIKLTTIAASQPIVGNASGDSCGFTIPIADAGTISPNLSTLQTTLNGVAIVPGTSRQGEVTTLTFDPPTDLAPGSTNTVVINFNSSDGTAISQTRIYVVPAATVITPAWATTQFTASSSGFAYRIHQLAAGRGPGDANFVEQGENQIAGGFLNFDGSIRANVADPSAAVGVAELINWEQNGTDLANNPDNFNSVEPEAAPQANALIPAIPGTIEEIPDTDNVAAEILTFLELKRGCTTLGVNSDDGFVVNLGHSAFGPVLGSYSGGRGASDTTFRIYVEQDGVYPVRLVWWEGGGGANVEFFSVVGTNKYLINDRTQTAAIKAYSAGSTPGYLNEIAPANNWNGANPNGPLVITFTNGLTTLNQSSLILTLDGQTVTPQVTTAGATTTVRYAPTTPWAFDSRHSGSIVYSFGSGTTVTQNFNFGVRARFAADVAGPTVGGFFIEAEHFDYDGGQMVPSVNTMPYTGNEYLDLVGVHDSDYHQTYSEPDGTSLGYRVEDPNVPMNRQITGAPDLDVDRGSFIVEENYKIGWANEGDWYDYTRTFTNGNYHVWVVQSHGDPIGTPDRQRVKMSIINGANETFFGSYQEPASGNWDSSTINQLMVGPVPAVVTLGGIQTIRVHQREGDFDWFVLVPTTNAVPAQQFIIEAEDFNHGSGQTVAAANNMPLTTAPYAGLTAVQGVDVNVNAAGEPGDAGSFNYRTNEVPHVPMNVNQGWDQHDRGTFVRSPNYKIGWTDSGEWFNYTRTFPQGNYNVYAALSHGGGGPTAGSLQKVTGATTASQTVEELGTFNAPGGTGGWGNNRLVPMTTSSGSLATIPLSGAETVRFTMGSGADFDYLVFVPSTGTVTPPTSRITTVSRSGNNLTINWTGGGRLHSAPALNADGSATWTLVAGQTATSATVPISGNAQFFMVRP